MKSYNLKSLISPGFIFVFVILALMIFVHLYLISKTLVFDNENNIRTAYAGYGDIPLHLTQITKFAHGQLDNLSEPIYLGEKIKYPFIINLISGLFLRFTGALRFSVLLPVMFFAAGNILLLFLIYKKIMKNKIFAVLALVLFFFGSGFGAYSYIRKAVDQRQSFSDFAQELTVNNVSVNNQLSAKYPDQNIVYNAPIDLAFLHQRPFFMGLFGFLLVFLLLYSLVEKNLWKYTIFAGLVYGLLPLVHTHSFVAVSIFLAVIWAVSLVYKKKEIAKKVVMAAVIGIIIALPQMYYLLGTKNTLGKTADFASFRVGWMIQPTIGSVQFPEASANITAFSLPYLKFTIMNLGLIFPFFLLIIALVFFAKKFRHDETGGFSSFWFLVLAATSLILFLVVELIKLQPWDFDNNKLLVYWQLCLAPLIMMLFLKIINKKKALGVLALLAFLLVSLASGFLDMLPRVLVSEDKIPLIFDINARALARYIQDNISVDEKILTGTSHLNPVASLTGRDVLVGYPGWLWTRGINYSAREDLIKKFYASPSKNDQLINQFNIKYVLIDYQTIFDFKSDLPTFDKAFQKVFQAGQFTLYKI